jgi:hypothetical protein
MEQALPITAKKWHQALVDAGVTREDDKIRRIVIDAKMNDVVVIHVERVGDTRLLDVMPTLAGIEIRTTPTAPLDESQLQHALGVIGKLADQEYLDAGNATPAERLSAIRRTVADYRQVSV